MLEDNTLSEITGQEHPGLTGIYEVRIVFANQDIWHNDKSVSSCWHSDEQQKPYNKKV